MHFTSLFKSGVMTVAIATIAFFGCNNENPVGPDVVTTTYADSELPYLNVVDVSIPVEYTDSTNAWYNNTFIKTLMQYPGLSASYRYQNQDINTDYFTFFTFPTKTAIDSLGKSPFFKQAIADANSLISNEEFSINISGNYVKIKSWVKESYKGELQAATMEAFDLLTSVETAFTAWYSDTHLPLIMKYSGVKKAVLYCRADAAATDLNRCSLPKYIALFYYGTKAEQTSQETSAEWSAVTDDKTKQTIDDGVSTIVQKFNFVKSFAK